MKYLYPPLYMHSKKLSVYSISPIFVFVAPDYQRIKRIPHLPFILFKVYILAEIKTKKQHIQVHGQKLLSGEITLCQSNRFY